MVHEERLSDMPGPLRWFLIMYRQVGFPMLVCAFLAYMYFVEQVKSRQSMDEFRSVINSLKTSIDQQNRLLRRRNIDQ